MARIPLLQMSDISLTFGGDPVFDCLDLVVQPNDRVALVGRNGSGKSTLMKVMAWLNLIMAHVFCPPVSRSDIWSNILICRGLPLWATLRFRG